MEVAAGTYDIEVAGGRLECSLPGRVKRDSTRFVSVGDLVEVEQLEDGSGRIAKLLPRESALTRHGVARRREQVIVANVDQVAAVVSATRPDPDFSMVDRLLALAELNEVTGLVIVNKVDLLQDQKESDQKEREPRQPHDSGDAAALTDSTSGRLPTDFKPYVNAGYQVLLTSAARGIGLRELRSRLADRITVLSGPSGVGKSSLLNALVPGLDLRVGDVGERKGRGRHTTVAAALYPFPDGGYVADTPGLQYLALWEVDPADLTHAFPEFAEPAAGCRFANCRHRDEPDCEVRTAVEAKSVSERRYAHYLALLAEAEEGR